MRMLPPHAERTYNGEKHVDRYGDHFKALKKAVRKIDGSYAADRDPSERVEESEVWACVLFCSLRKRVVETAGSRPRRVPAK